MRLVIYVDESPNFLFVTGYITTDDMMRVLSVDNRRTKRQISKSRESVPSSANPSVMKNKPTSNNTSYAFISGLFRKANPYVPSSPLGRRNVESWESSVNSEGETNAELEHEKKRAKDMKLIKINSKLRMNSGVNDAMIKNMTSSDPEDLDPELKERVHRLMLRADVNGQGVITYAGNYCI